MKITARVPVTLAQDKAFREAFRSHERLGDCTYTRMVLRFTDTEGANALKGTLIQQGPKDRSTRSYITWNSIVDRIDAAVRKALTQQPCDDCGAAHPTGCACG